MLPRLNGMELLRRLRSERRTPVLLLTARDATSDRVRGLDGGADDYLVKPFDLEELLARLRAVIRRHKGQTTSRIGIGEYELNLSARTLSKAGQLVALTAREYSLLEYLALRRGSVVSRTELIEHRFDPIARDVLPGVRTRGTAGNGRTECYGAADVHAIDAIRGRWQDTDLGELAQVFPDPGFGFGSTPRRPGITSLTTTVIGPE